MKIWEHKSIDKKEIIAICNSLDELNILYKKIIDEQHNAIIKYQELLSNG